MMWMWGLTVAEAKPKPKPPEPVQAQATGASNAAEAPTVDLKYDTFTLDNGLRVVVHEDHKAPIVAVGIWYGVGSGSEPPGRTGFAHLYEHLMFQGTENYKGEYFEPFEQVGATDQNGTTWFDRTNYFENVPTPALEMALWMESDRMGHLLGSIDQAKLDEQRGVVQNEKRQGDNQPYGKLEYHVLEGLYPEGHPYHHTTIGSMEDLNAASLDDVKTWFQTYYGASNTVLVLAGDVDLAHAKPLVEKYFGWIAAGPPVPHLQAWVPQRTETVSEVLYDRVPQVRLQEVWAVPGQTTQDAALLEIAAAVLGQGKTSRLYKALVYDEQLCTNVSASVEGHQLASPFTIDATVAPGKDPAQVKARVDQILADFLKSGPTDDELGRARTTIGAGLVRGLERIGGFGGKIDALGEGLLYAGDPSFFYKQRIDWMNAATAADVGNVARTWLSKGHYEVAVRPYEDAVAKADTADRTKLPSVPSPPPLEFPKVEVATLSNGVKVVLAERHAVPVVDVAMRFDAGYASDPADKVGLSSFTAAMLDEGTATRSSLDIASQLESLGAELSTGSSLDSTVAQLSALKANVKPSVELLADVVRNPKFDQAELDRLRGRWLARIAQEKAQPSSLAMRLLPPELYGKGHPYGVPLTGTGDEASIKALTRDDLVKYEQTWLRPDLATLFVVGDTTMAEIQPILEASFGNWAAPSTPKPTKAFATVTPPAKSKVILLDKPGAEQSLILAGIVAPPSGTNEDVAITAMNDVIGGQFSARLNMNLREAKHWSYGAYTFLPDAVGQRPMMAFAPVQTDKTAESMKEIDRELRDFVGKKPATTEEFDRVVKNEVRGLPGQFETADAVMDSLLSSSTYGRPWDYPSTLAQAYGALKPGDLAKEASALIKPTQLVWVVVGDRSKIEASVKAAGLGDVEVRPIPQ
jgi:zinc protease